MVMDREAWRATIHGVTEFDMTEWLNWTEDCNCEMCVYNIKSSDLGPILGPGWSHSKILHLIMSANKAIVFVSSAALTKCHRLDGL